MHFVTICYKLLFSFIYIVSLFYILFMQKECKKCIYSTYTFLVLSVSISKAA